MGKETLYQVSRAITRRLARLSVEGEEHFPQCGPLIAFINHPPKKSRLFYLCLLAAIPSRFSVLIKSQTPASYPSLISRVGIRLIGLSGIVGLINIERPSGVKKALKALSSGEIIAISAEGEVNNGQGLLQARPGIAALAEKSQAPMVPLAITGSRRHLSVTIGRPFSLSEIEIPQFPNRHEHIQFQADRIMCRLAVLLPPEERGYYASMC